MIDKLFIHALLLLNKCADSLSQQALFVFDILSFPFDSLSNSLSSNEKAAVASPFIN